MSAFEKLEQKALEEVHEYRKLGTVEEVREAVKKAKVKKPKFYATNWYCPVCGYQITDIFLIIVKNMVKNWRSKSNMNFAQKAIV